jgi:hypothetical protein
MELLGKLLDAGKGLPGLRRDGKRKTILREQLEEPHPLWCSLATLSGAIGASEKRTKSLLISIGARGSRGNKKDMWGLKSRVDDPANRGQPTDEA